MKRILLALDSSKPGMAAQEYAIDMAKRFNASLTGIAVLDTPWITAAQPEPLGGSAFKMHRDDMVIRQSKEHLDFLLEGFRAACMKAKVNYETRETEGFPALEIEYLSHEHDIIVIGRVTDFHFDLDDDSDITVRHIARDNPRPILLIPESVGKTSNRIMVAFDGSMQASRSLQLFLLLGLAHKAELHVVAGNKYLDKAEILAKRALTFCQAYGVKTVQHPFQMTGSAAESLIKHAQDLDVSQMVIGGFSHTVLHEAFFGSCTKTLMRQSPVPLFMHH